jgi:hypothetical protein
MRGFALCFFEAALGDDHVCARFCQRTHDPLADTLTASGNKRGAAFKLAFHRISFLSRIAPHGPMPSTFALNGTHSITQKQMQGRVFAKNPARTRHLHGVRAKTVSRRLRSLRMG